MIFDFFQRRVLRRVLIGLLRDFLRFRASFGLPLGALWVTLAYLWAENLSIFEDPVQEGLRGSPGGGFWSHFGSFLDDFSIDLGAIFDDVWTRLCEEI